MLRHWRLLTGTALAVLMLTGAATAEAGGRHGHYGHDHHGYHEYGYHHAPRHRYRRHRDDNDGEVLVGILIGGLIGYAIGNAHHSTAHHQDAPRHTDYEPYPVFDETPYAASTAPPSYPCLQEREYQTKVIIGGRQVDAYGTACLQPDGSWRHGPASAR